MKSNEQETVQAPQRDGREVRALSSASLAGSEPPKRILIAPWGHVESTNGSFIVDEESARLAIEAFDEHGTDLPIDYEHQTLGGTYASPSGQAPAAGWIKRIVAEPGVGLVADIEWTGHATQQLMAREYRYLSPVAIIRKSDRRLVEIHSAALTNKPAIRGMTPIVSRDESDSGNEADEELLALRRTLGLPPEADVIEVLIAAGRRMSELNEEATRKHLERRINDAVRSGKLVEAQRDWAAALVAKEEGLFDEWLRTAPVIVAPGRIPPPSDAGEASGPKGAAARNARAEFRANPWLAGLTSEDAYAGEAERAARLPTVSLCPSA